MTTHDGPVNRLETIRATVRAFVLTRTGEPDLEDDTDFFRQGLATSLFAMEIITFVEREFAFTVEVEDLSLDNFRSISACAAFVAAKDR